MALRYSADILLHLRNSPLCTRPDNLPPAEEWMGPPPDQIRPPSKTGADRPRANDSSVLDQGNRRSGTERHISRSSANPEDLVFGPRTGFPSSRDRSSRDLDAQGRTATRNRTEGDGDRLRDGRVNPLRRRGDTDQDGEGWNMVRPRKSFGAENAERFSGKMGGSFRDDRRPQRDGKDEREGGAARDRNARGFDSTPRDRDGADGEARIRNGTGRNKADNWRTNDSASADTSVPQERRERDRAKSWRDRDRDQEALDDRAPGRTNDRRWAREQRQAREPAWFDEPVDQKEAHTQQDFQKWMEQMKRGDGGAASSSTNTAAEAAAETSKKPALPSSSVEAGPDKFFMAFGGKSAEATTPGEGTESTTATKAKPAGKSSRFTSFFAQPQADSRPRTEPPVPQQQSSAPLNDSGGLGALFSAASQSAGAGGPTEERQAFQQLLAKLQKQTLSATPPGPAPFGPPPPQHQQPQHESKKSAVGSPELFQQYGGERRDVPPGRPPNQQAQEILAPRPQAQSARPDQLLKDLVNQHQRVSSQGSSRPEPNAARNNSNTEFLMNLMNMGPDAQRVGAQSQPQPHHHKLSPMPPFNEREREYAGQENRGAERQARQQPPPGFPMEDGQGRPPPPPGLGDMPPGWMGGGPGRGQMPGPPPPPPPGGPMMSPPGMPGGPGRNMGMPPMFPPNFPPGGMPPPPPEAMGGMPPPRGNMPPPPPPGFFNGPPPGFLPPGIGGFNGPPPGPEGFNGPPFEGRGGPLPDGRGQGANYGRS